MTLSMRREVQMGGQTCKEQGRPGISRSARGFLRRREIFRKGLSRRRYMA